MEGLTAVTVSWPKATRRAANAGTLTACRTFHKVMTGVAARLRFPGPGTYWSDRCLRQDARQGLAGQFLASDRDHLSWRGNGRWP